MSVVRYDLNNCIGCQNCVTVWPMDVFRFDYEQNKSVIAYPENCQSCGQCFMGCQGRSLEISFYQQAFAIPAARAAATNEVTPAEIQQATHDQPEKSKEAAEAAAAEKASSGK